MKLKLLLSLCVLIVWCCSLQVASAALNEEEERQREYEYRQRQQQYYEEQLREREAAATSTSTTTISPREPYLDALQAGRRGPPPADDRNHRSQSILPSSTSSRWSFSSCCQEGKQASNSSSSSSSPCGDHSRLYDQSESCKLAYTICCNQERRDAECERGKQYAIDGHECGHLRSSNLNQAVTEECDVGQNCCQCCELGIRTRKEASEIGQGHEECQARRPELSTECNSLFTTCCSNAVVEVPVDTCTSRTHVCPHGQICENTQQGPTCLCPVGYEMDARSRSCVDIDECRLSYSNPPCERGSRCQNTVGSYECTKSCGSGYLLNAIIVQCQDIDECSRGTHNCPRGMRCENYPGSFRCIREVSCGTGYQVNVYTQECDDVDECAFSLHDCAKGFTCINLPGTFKCKAKECAQASVFNFNTGECEAIQCLPGYAINKQTNRCEDVDECSAKYENETGAPVCNPFNERCDNLPGSFKCTLVLICEEGFEINEAKTECVDIDECSSGRHTCPPTARCVNTPRSYKCVCPKGYRLDENRNRCEDIDECAAGNVCPSNSYCRNTPGSYSCDCKQGFHLVSHIFYSCVDDDECAADPDICDHKCVNTYGSYQCACKEGYRLDVDKRTCVDINECVVQPNLCPGICTNTPGSYECSCETGFVRKSRFCEDVDECAVDKNSCSQDNVCVNTRGNFKCMNVQCPTGYALSGDTKNSRCDRVNAVCRYGETECLRQPMKIFHSYTSFSYLVPVPIRIFTTRVNTYSRRIRLEYEFKVVDEQGESLRKDQFLVKKTEANTFDIYLLEACKAAETLNLELKIEFYNDNQFSSCLLNKIVVFVTG